MRCTKANGEKYCIKYAVFITIDSVAVRTIMQIAIALPRSQIWLIISSNYLLASYDSCYYNYIASYPAALTSIVSFISYYSYFLNPSRACTIRVSIDATFATLIQLAWNWLGYVMFDGPDTIPFLYYIAGFLWVIEKQASYM